MLKFYIASPFFCDYDILIRDKMVKQLISTFDCKYFRPDSTDANKVYDKKHTMEMARQIYKENIEHIEDADALIFPKHTQDLGTLMEVGFATALKKSIFRYDYLDNSISDITSICQKELSYLDQYLKVDKKVIIDCSNLAGGIAFGYSKVRNPDISYSLTGLQNNLMLGATSDKYIKINNAFMLDKNVRIEDLE